jgi:regulator of protease activity HflC (stomatin/prohibitin superfamily)
VAELLRQILDLIRDLSPVRVVQQWQMGLYHVGGRYWRTVGPGVQLVIPYLCEVHKVSVVPAAATTPLQTVTLRDGRTLTFSVTITYAVSDANRAFNHVERYQETVIELASGVVAEVLADADPERFDPARGNRSRLLEEVREELDAECQRFGLAVHRLRLTNFALGVRTIRLLLDRAVLSEGNHLGV